MPRSLRIAYLAHSLRSDWNNGNAHFLRGLLRATAAIGHDVQIFERDSDWSIENLRREPDGERSLDEFARTYSDLRVETYAVSRSLDQWREHLRDREIVMLHEWNAPALAQTLLQLRDELGFTLLFHDTHHRASSSPESFDTFGLSRFDGVIAFGEVLRRVYRDRFKMERVFVLHEAADTTIFHPLPSSKPAQEIVWIGNWGDDERSAEIREFLLEPAARLRAEARTTILGVRYPVGGLAALADAGVSYGGYLPNLDAPALYGQSRLTVHIPRRQYATTMEGIPTIRVFEALACGIPLLSAPWRDTEELFRPGDFGFVRTGEEMFLAMQTLLKDRAAAEDQAARGLETVLARHTCVHRARELTAICEDLLS